MRAMCGFVKKKCNAVPQRGGVFKKFFKDCYKVRHGVKKVLKAAAVCGCA